WPHYHVAASSDSRYQRPAPCGVEIESDALFASVVEQVGEAPLWAFLIVKERPAPAHVVPVGVFDADDPGAQLRQQPRPEYRRLVRQVEDGDTSERQLTRHDLPTKYPRL